MLHNVRHGAPEGPLFRAGYHSSATDIVLVGARSRTLTQAADAFVGAFHSGAPPRSDSGDKFLAFEQLAMHAV